MKRNKALRIAAILLTLVLITTCGMVGTLAKYVDTFPGASKLVRAGLFHVVGDMTNLTFDIFEGDGSGAEGNASAYANTGIDDILVPGMRLQAATGSSATIYNYSEVDVYVEVVGFSVADGWDGLLFSIDGTNWFSKGDFEAEITAGRITANQIFSISNPVVGAKTGQVTVTPALKILWPYANVSDGDVIGYQQKGAGVVTAMASGALGYDNVAGNGYAIDTGIGRVAAKDYFTAIATACDVYEPCTEDDCEDHFKGNEDEPCNEVTCDHSTCAYIAADDLTVQDPITWTNTLSISFSIRATQID